MTVLGSWLVDIVRVQVSVRVMDSVWVMVCVWVMAIASVQVSVREMVHNSRQYHS